METPKKHPKNKNTKRKAIPNEKQLQKTHKANMKNYL